MLWMWLILCKNCNHRHPIYILSDLSIRCPTCLDSQFTTGCWKESDCDSLFFARSSGICVKDAARSPIQIRNKQICKIDIQNRFSSIAVAIRRCCNCAASQCASNQYVFMMWNMRYNVLFHVQFLIIIILFTVLITKKKKHIFYEFI